MTRNIDNSLDKLNELLATMSGLVETAIEASTTAWKSKNIIRIKEVFKIEENVNDTHKKIDLECLKLLALHQPMAFDLRLIIAAIKINTDLERMVDLAVNIAQITEYYLTTLLRIEPLDLVQMANKVRLMVTQALDSFVKKDVEMAIDVLRRDDFVDELKRKIFSEMLEKMKLDNSLVDEGLHNILIAKNLERIADHATNIAEDVVFVISGKDIRHPSLKRSKNGK